MLDERLAIFRRRLLRWYDASRRDLPWRLPMGAPRQAMPDPYHVLLSETMLQQTQVATVIPYFNRFVRRFPTLRALADADEQDVLRMWQGLGYYSRARNLLAAARTVIGELGGELPRTAEALRRLPGIGRYTAGAIASIAFRQRAPILDGNVMRVLCRIDRIESDPRETVTQQRLWERAGQLVPKDCAGEFNSAMMELGATVCTPRSPQCLICPVNRHCQAFAAGLQDRIPPPRQAKPTPLLRRWTICLQRKHDRRWLLEQRPATGRWAGMWQFVTIEAAAEADAAPTAATVRAALSVRASKPVLLGTLTHGLTHRRYSFDVFRCETDDGKAAVGGNLRRWVGLDELAQYPLPKPHVMVSRLLTNSA
jgi:A/G-specific adenine glycosylase